MHDADTKKPVPRTQPKGWSLNRISERLNVARARLEPQHLASYHLH